MNCRIMGLKLMSVKAILFVLLVYYGMMNKKNVWKIEERCGNSFTSLRIWGIWFWECFEFWCEYRLNVSITNIWNLWFVTSNNGTTGTQFIAWFGGNYQIQEVVSSDSLGFGKHVQGNWWHWGTCSSVSASFWNGH